jgi:hypothetical protein
LDTSFGLSQLHGHAPGSCVMWPFGAIENHCPHDTLTITEQEIGTTAEFDSDRLELYVQDEERAFRSTSTNRNQPHMILSTMQCK